VQIKVLLSELFILLQKGFDVAEVLKDGIPSIFAVPIVI
jgi:hypothetical protein